MQGYIGDRLQIVTNRRDLKKGLERRMQRYQESAAGKTVLVTYVQSTAITRLQSSTVLSNCLSGLEEIQVKDLRLDLSEKHLEDTATVAYSVSRGGVHLDVNPRSGKGPFADARYRVTSTSDYTVLISALTHLTIARKSRGIEGQAEQPRVSSIPNTAPLQPLGVLTDKGALNTLRQQRTKNTHTVVRH
jgi:hypothetical protein